jgi:peptidoglycan-associated lipoprotein
MGLQFSRDLARRSRQSNGFVRGGPGVTKRILGIALLAIAMGCASPAPEPSGGEGESGGFGPEGAAADPGMQSGTGSSGTEAGAAALRSIYFDYDQDVLRESARADLRHNAQILNSNPGMQVEIQGHCDERGSDEYNLALGMRRAETAKRYLIDLGVSGARLSTTSLGEERPAVSGHSEAAWSKNRRDEFKNR